MTIEQKRDVLQHMFNQYFPYGCPIKLSYQFCQDIIDAYHMALLSFPHNGKIDIIHFNDFEQFEFITDYPRRFFTDGLWREVGGDVSHPSYYVSFRKLQQECKFNINEWIIA